MRRGARRALLGGFPRQCRPPTANSLDLCVPQGFATLNIESLDCREAQRAPRLAHWPRATLPQGTVLAPGLAFVGGRSKPPL